MNSYYLQSLDVLIYLLEKDGDYIDWIEWLKKDIDDFKGLNSVEHHLQTYGGMGSFNDLYLSQLNDQEKMIFNLMKEFCYNFAVLYKRIHKDICVLEKEVLNEILYQDKEKRNPLFILILDGLQSGNFLDFYLHNNKYQNIKSIVFSRDSVCMADDMNENTRVYDCHVNHPYKSILSIIKEYNFLPNISGNDVVWVAINMKGKEIFSYFTKTDKLVLISNKQSIDDICEGVYKINFRYYYSSQLRGQYLFEQYKGDTYQMWRDGALAEYQYCSITRNQEEEWKKEI